ncbi:isochorismatase family protein [Streptomyces sp. NPDC007088]|uniref:isochorismatase family protein n=1 Tax=Streptomyces sp. NPDC007088 TaxID=3364773 RepID=UPI0036A43B63
MTSVLLLIDLQRSVFAPPDPVPDAAGLREAVAALLAGARASGTRVIHVRHNDPRQAGCVPGSHGWHLEHAAREDEPVVDKRRADAFEETGLAGLLPAGVTVTVAGVASGLCVRATVLSALRRGHPVRLVRGAHADWDGEVPAALTRRAVERELSAAGARLVPLAQAVVPVREALSSRPRRR